jgi:hypothetical protein
LPSCPPSSPTLGRRTIYLTWADPGDGTAASPRWARQLVCEAAGDCRIDNLERIWRQQPAIRSPGHYSHKIAFSPDGKYLFLSSGERMQGDPAQQLDTNLGKVLRLNLDGTPAEGNLFRRSRRGQPRDLVLRPPQPARPRSTSTASCGTSSTPRGGDGSTRSSPATTTAGRSARTATTTTATTSWTTRPTTASPPAIS